MDVARLLLMAVVALGLAVPAAQAQNAGKPVAQPAPKQVQVPRPAKPWKEVRGFRRVLDLSKLPIVIDEPGLYTLQRDWQFDFPVGIQMVQITADEVTLDLHGFEISIPNGPVDTTIVAITGDMVTVRNGHIVGCCEGVTAVRSTGIGTRLDHLDVFSHDRMLFEGSAAVIADSTIFSRDGIQADRYFEPPFCAGSSGA